LALSTWYYLATTWNEARNSDEVHWSLGAINSSLTGSIFNLNNVSVIGNNGTFTIGNSSPAGSGGFVQTSANPGRIDELAIYDHELTAEAISTQFAAIPEPSTLILRSSALLGLYAVVRRHRAIKR
jgi:hypothetical protein